MIEKEESLMHEFDTCVDASLYPPLEAFRHFPEGKGSVNSRRRDYGGSWEERNAFHILGRDRLLRLRGGEDASL